MAKYTYTFRITNQGTGESKDVPLGLYDAMSLITDMLVNGITLTAKSDGFEAAGDGIVLDPKNVEAVFGKVKKNINTAKPKKKKPAKEPNQKTKAAAPRERILLLHKKGWDPNRIAHKLECSPAKVYYHLKALGISVNNGEKIAKQNKCSLCGEPGHKKSKCPKGDHHGQLRMEERPKSTLPEEVQKQIQDMRNEDKTTTEIARELDLDPDEVAKVYAKREYGAGVAQKPVKARPLSGEEFETLQEEKNGVAFATGKWALVHGLSPTEVSTAMEFDTYGEYIESPLAEQQS